MQGQTLRLLYVIDSLAPGGAETSLVAMTPALVARGVDLHILPLGAALDLAPALAKAGAHVHERAGRPGRLDNIRTVFETARQLKPDLIHTTLFEADLAGRTAARMHRIPCSTSLVNEYYGSSHAGESPALKLRAARSLDRTTARWATRFHAVSEAVAKSVGPALRLQRDLIDVIPRGRDPRDFPFVSDDTRHATRKSLGLATETPVILAVGRHEPQKGFQHLLDAVSLISLGLSDTVVLIAGRDGRVSQSLRDQVTSLPLEVRLLGHRTDIPALMAAADVLAFPSEREGSPGTLIEAMATGLPIVASDIAPCLEVLGGPDPVTALVARAGDPTALANAILSALTDVGQARSRAVIARRRFERFYTIDSVANQMADFFWRVAGPTQIT